MPTLRDNEIEVVRFVLPEASVFIPPGVPRAQAVQLVPPTIPNTVSVIPGPRGPAGQDGEGTSTDPDLPDLTLLLENGLI